MNFGSLLKIAPVEKIPVKVESNFDTTPVATGCINCSLSIENGNKIYGRVMPDTSMIGDNNVVIFGEAPGENEDRTGIPFSHVGKSGELLRKVLSGINQSYIIDNITRCRPPKNRDPSNFELNSCLNHTVSLFEKYRPTVVISVGKVPTDFLVSLSDTKKSTKPVNTNGRFLLNRILLGDEYFYYWLCPVIHPSVLVRNGIKLEDFGLPSKTGRYRDLLVAFNTSIKNAFLLVNEVKNLNTTTFIDSLYKGIYTVTPKEMIELSSNLPKYLGFDIETVGNVFDNGYIHCYSVSNGVNTYVTFNDKSEDFITSLYNITYNRSLIVHSATMELLWLIKLFGEEYWKEIDLEDTLIQEFVLNTPENGPSYSLDFLTYQYLGISVKELTDVDPTKLYKYSEQEIAIYNGLDSKSTYYLWLAQSHFLRFRNLQDQYKLKVKDQVIATFDTFYGLNLDLEGASVAFNVIDKDIESLGQELKNHDAVRNFVKHHVREFSPSSPVDVSVVLELDPVTKQYFTDLGIKISSNKNILSEIEQNIDDTLPISDFISSLLGYRSMFTMRNTYLKPVVEREFIYSDNRSHADFFCYGTKTGRFTAKNPNVLNMPRRNSKLFRDLIVSKEGYSFIRPDLGQIEARIIAAVCGDEVFASYIRDGNDIHKEWALKFLEYPSFKNYIVTRFEIDDESKLFSKARDVIKGAWTFPVIYGAMPKKLATILKITEKEASDMRNIFFSTYKGIKSWQTYLVDYYYKHGYVIAPTGFRIYNASKTNEIYNMPIQHTGNCMNNVASYKLLELGYKVCLHVHDEMLIEVPDEDIDKAVKDVSDTILSLDTYPKEWHSWLTNVPFATDIKSGKKYGSLQLVDTFSKRMQ